MLFINLDKDRWQNTIDYEDETTNIRQGSRYIICGTPNSGKTSLLKKMLINSESFDKIYIMHYEGSREFECLNYNYIENFSELSNIDLKNEALTKKILIIIEDVNKINNKDYLHLEPILSYYCSHLGITLIMLSQTPYMLDINLRRKIDVYLLFGGGCDVSFLNSLKIINKDDKILILDLLNKSKKHDFVRIDLTTKKYYFNEDKIK